MLIRSKYNRFYQKYILLHPNNNLDWKMKLEDYNAEHKIHE
jgi:hypothetical protein